MTLPLRRDDEHRLAARGRRPPQPAAGDAHGQPLTARWEPLDRLDSQSRLYSRRICHPHATVEPGADGRQRQYAAGWCANALVGAGLTLCDERADDDEQERPRGDGGLGGGVDALGEYCPE